MPSILQPWVQDLGLRHQGVIVSGMRGCDLAPRHDPSKIAQRLLRGAVLEPHCGRLVKPASYMITEPDHRKWWDMITPFLSSWDHYPNHFVMHFIHTTEIIAYCGSVESPVFADRWLDFYMKAMHLLHVNPETKAQLDERLNADEELFKKMQIVKA